MSRGRKAVPTYELENAVNDVGHALSTLQGVFDTHGGQLTHEQHTKVFSFLGQTFDAVETKTALSIGTAAVLNGAFKLDMQLPERPATPHAAGQTLHFPPGVRAGAPMRGPRLLTEPGPAAKPDEDLKELNLENSDIPGVGFIED